MLRLLCLICLLLFHLILYSQTPSSHVLKILDSTGIKTGSSHLVRNIYYNQKETDQRKTILLTKPENIKLAGCYLWLENEKSFKLLIYNLQGNSILIRLSSSSSIKVEQSTSNSLAIRNNGDSSVISGNIAEAFIEYIIVVTSSDISFSFSINNTEHNDLVFMGASKLHPKESNYTLKKLPTTDYFSPSVVPQKLQKAKKDGREALQGGGGRKR